MGVKVVYDGSTYTIKVKSGVTDIDAKVDLYSDAKEDWVNQVDNLHHFPFPFVVIGGNSIGGGQFAPSYYFLQYPWVIETNGDGVLHTFGLNLYGSAEDGSSRDPFNVIAGDSLTNRVSDIPSSSGDSGVVVGDIECASRCPADISMDMKSNDLTVQASQYKMRASLDELLRMESKQNKVRSDTDSHLRMRHAC